MNDVNDSFLVGFADAPLEFLFSSHGHLDHIANLVQQGGLANYEAPTPSVFVALCRESGGIVLDVGANTGLFSLLAAAANPAVRVCAFEPLATVRSLLEANLELNPALQSRISVQPFGLSRSNGNVTFYETINDYGVVTTSSSIELNHAQEVGNYREQTIEIRTLDDWGDRLGPAPVQFLKIDVEGHEHAVIEGGRRFLARHRPYITIEVLGAAETRSMNDLLIEGGYLDFALAPGELRQCADVHHHSDAWNHLLCPVERAGRLFPLCRELGLQLTVS